MKGRRPSLRTSLAGGAGVVLLGSALLISLADDRWDAAATVATVLEATAVIIGLTYAAAQVKQARESQIRGRAEHLRDRLAEAVFDAMSPDVIDVVATTRSTITALELWRTRSERHRDVDDDVVDEFYAGRLNKAAADSDEAARRLRISVERAERAALAYGWEDRSFLGIYLAQTSLSLQASWSWGELDADVEAVQAVLVDLMDELRKAEKRVRSELALHAPGATRGR